MASGSQGYAQVHRFLKAVVSVSVQSKTSYEEAINRMRNNTGEVMDNDNKIAQVYNELGLY